MASSKSNKNDESKQAPAKANIKLPTHNRHINKWCFLYIKAKLLYNL